MRYPDLQAQTTGTSSSLFFQGTMLGTFPQPGSAMEYVQRWQSCWKIDQEDMPTTPEEMYDALIQGMDYGGVDDDFQDAPAFIARDPWALAA